MKPINKAKRLAGKIRKKSPWAERCRAVHAWRKAMDGVFNGR